MSYNCFVITGIRFAVRYIKHVKRTDQTTLACLSRMVGKQKHGLTSILGSLVTFIYFLLLQKQLQ